MKAGHLHYIGQLDSFRFLAVLLVIISHWLPNLKINTLPNGFLGVTFFFVLSGFLISSNLLYMKKAIESKQVTFWYSVKTFYIRRSLRIFPLYIFVIILVFSLIPLIFKGHLLWYLFYIPNFLVFKLQTWPEMLSHFWSLGVEEQFYFVWPFMIFLFPWRSLKYLFPIVVLASVIFKFVLFRAGDPFFNFYDVLPLSCFDAFGIGAILALILVDKRQDSIALTRLPVWIGFPVFTLLAIIIFKWGISPLFGITVSIASFYLILGAVKQFKGLSSLLLDNPAIRYLGKISYGLYVYHNFIPWLLRCLKGEETEYPLSVALPHLSWLHGGGLTFIVQFLILVAIASASWFIFERPINNLKKYFI